MRSTTSFTKQGQLARSQQAALSFIQLGLENSQRMESAQPLQQAAPLPDCPHGVEAFHYIQYESLLFQFMPLALPLRTILFPSSPLPPHRSGQDTVRSPCILPLSREDKSSTCAPYSFVGPPLNSFQFTDVFLRLREEKNLKWYCIDWSPSVWYHQQT